MLVLHPAKVMGHCVNNLYAGKLNIHAVHQAPYRMRLMNFRRGRAEHTLRFGAQIAHGRGVGTR